MYMLFVYVCMHAFLAWAAKWWKNYQSSFSAANGKLAMDKVLFEDVLPTVNTFQLVSSPEAQAPLRHRFHLQKHYMQVRFGRICSVVFSLGDWRYTTTFAAKSHGSPSGVKHVFSCLSLFGEGVPIWHNSWTCSFWTGLKPPCTDTYQIFHSKKAQT